MSTTTLYRLFDSTGDLLYVGISLRVYDRFIQHKVEKRWWTEVARADFENWPSRPEALSAERQAIRSEQPKYNLVHSRARKQAPRRSAPMVAETGADVLALKDIVDSIDRLDAERDEVIANRNAAAAELLVGHTSRALGQRCGVTHQTVRNWAEAAR